MSSQLSVSQILANLESRMKLHQERQAHHAEQEAFHREQRAHHAAEHEAVARHYEAFKASADVVAEMAARPSPVQPAPEPGPPQEKMPPGKPLASKLVALVVAELPAGEAFAPSQVAAEVNRRYSTVLRKPVDARLASTCLRRLLADGRVRLARKGTAHHQALYSRR